MTRKDYLEPIELNEDIDPWEQQPPESDKQFEAFKIYLDLEPHADVDSGVLGQRRLSKIYGRTAYSDTYVQDIARKMQWATRARAWDESEDSGIRGALEHNRRVVLRNRLNQLSEVNQLILKVMRSMAEDVSAWKPRDVAAMWEVAMRAENELLSMTRLGGPSQQVVALGAHSEVTVGSLHELEAQTVEVVEELRRRALLGEPIEGHLVPGE
jgi:hypothetical protein